MSTTRPTTTVGLDDPAAAAGELAGGKAATLARLRRQDLPVPDGFVIPTATVSRWLEQGTDAQDVVAVPDHEREALAEALDDLGSGPVAVRSSAVGEDAAEASFAGQYDTVLDVTGIDELVDAVATVAASSRGDRVSSYRSARRTGDTAIAILVQRMVPAEAAGVAFSANPVTGARDETLVSAVPGVAEALVSGEVAADEFVVRGGEVETVASPHDAIGADQVREIAALAERLEALAGAPQDIEWAISAEGLHLLQARPVTALPVEPDRDLPEGTWMKDTAHYPEPLTTLGNVFLDAIEDGSSLMCEEWGLMVDHIEQRSVGGEVYTRPIPVGGEKSGPTPPWWLIGILARVVPPMRSRMNNAKRMVDSGALEQLPRRWELELKPRIRTRIASLRDTELESLGDEELAAHLDDTIELLIEGQRIHFRLFMPYAVGVRELCEEADRLLGWTTGQTMELLQGLSGASSEPAQALDELADLIRDHPAAQEALEHPDGDLLARLEEIAPDIAAAVRAYRDDWGLRTVNYDPGAPTIAERPALLASLLRDAVDRAQVTARGGVDAARDDARTRARQELEEQGVSSADRRGFEQALAFAEMVYPLREDNLFWTDNVPTALVRRAALEIGRRLARNGRLDHPEDAVWLEIEELKQELSGSRAHGDLRSTIERRKGERRYVRANPGPDVIGPEPSPPPDVRGLPKAARRTNGALMWLMNLEGYVPGGDEQHAEADVVGTPASAGRHTGTVRVIRGEEDFHLLGPGDVLVAPITAPAWSVLFAQAGAVVTQTGGVLSHAAIVAREHGIPAVLGVDGVTTELQDGQTVTVDGRAGTIRLEEEQR
ncbi:MAG: PEP/pyruvate-binding domain-containing protein [Nitriliruptorales bacterium]|nr:PEP/pyruvate-binding domain-containing protein [Nitriliruptorales bacterium]